MFMFLLVMRVPPRSTIFPYTTLFRSDVREEVSEASHAVRRDSVARTSRIAPEEQRPSETDGPTPATSSLATATAPADRKSTRLNSSHVEISYAVFCLKKKNNQQNKSI